MSKSEFGIAGESDLYAALKPGKLTKAEALQVAQKAMITGDFANGDGNPVTGNQATGKRATLVVTRDTPSLSNCLNHPYYWAPFILIGNGL